MATRRHKGQVVKITSVTFRSCIPLGGKFQTVHVEASAAVGPNDDPSVTLEGVKRFVGAELRRAKEGSKPKPEVRPGRFQDILDYGEAPGSREPW